MQISTSWERQGQSKTILRLLNRKFGSIPSEITSTIQSLDSSSLDALTEDLLDFQSVDDLTAWLESH